jgi:hypothetical protein
MNDPQNKEESSGVRDKQIRTALDQHWAASDANDFETGGDKVWRETQHFADPFVAPASRAQWVERMDA